MEGGLEEKRKLGLLVDLLWGQLPNHRSGSVINTETASASERSTE